jgi:hypothetical protein
VQLFFKNKKRRKKKPCIIKVINIYSINGEKYLEKEQEYKIMKINTNHKNL